MMPCAIPLGKAIGDAIIAKGIEKPDPQKA